MAALCFFLQSCKNPSHQNTGRGIISLSPALTSLLMDLGLENRIMAVTRQDFMLSRPLVGSMIQFSLETLLSLKPGFVVYQDFQKPWIAPILETPEIRFIEISLSGLDSIFKGVKTLGQVFEVPESRMASVLSDNAPEKEKEPLRPFGFVALVDRDPELSKAYAAGKKSYLSELLALLGGKNALDSEKDYVPVSEEYLLSLNSEIRIIDFSPEKNLPRRFQNRPYFSIPDLWITLPDLKLKAKLLHIKKILNF